MNLNLKLLADVYCILKFAPNARLPAFIYDSDFYSVTRTPEEISVVTRQESLIKEAISCDKDWRILKIDGILDFSLVGIIAELTQILKENEIPVFIISTYNTDYCLLKQKYTEKAIKVLKNKGHKVQLDN